MWTRQSWSGLLLTTRVTPFLNLLNTLYLRTLTLTFIWSIEKLRYEVVIFIGQTCGFSVRVLFILILCLYFSSSPSLFFHQEIIKNLRGKSSNTLKSLFFFNAIPSWPLMNNDSSHALSTSEPARTSSTSRPRRDRCYTAGTCWGQKSVVTPGLTLPVVLDCIKRFQRCGVMKLRYENGESSS